MWNIYDSRCARDDRAKEKDKAREGKGRMRVYDNGAPVNSSGDL